MTTLLPDVDVEATKKNARRMLRQYSKLEREAGKNYSQRLTVEISDMPRGSASIRNAPVEDMVVNRVTSEKKCWDILETLYRIPRLSREILWYSYIVIDQWSVEELSEFFDYSYVGILKLKSKALMEFAEAYQPEQLQVLED